MLFVCSSCMFSLSCVLVTEVIVGKRNTTVEAASAFLQLAAVFTLICQIGSTAKSTCATLVLFFFRLLFLFWLLPFRPVSGFSAQYRPLLDCNCPLCCFDPALHVVDCQVYSLVVDCRGIFSMLLIASSYILLIAELSGVDCAQIWSWQQSEVGATGVEETNAAWYEPSRHIWWWRRLSWGPDGDTTITSSTGHPNSGFCTELWNFYSLTANNRGGGGGGALRAALGLVRILKSIAGYVKSSLIFPSNSDQCNESFKVWLTLVSLKKMKKNQSWRYQHKCS